MDTYICTCITICVLIICASMCRERERFVYVHAIPCHRRREVLLLFVDDLFAQPGAALARKPSATPTNAKQALCLSVTGWVSLPQVSTRHWLVWKPSTEYVQNLGYQFRQGRTPGLKSGTQVPPGYQTSKTSVADSLLSKMLGVLH